MFSELRPRTQAGRRQCRWLRGRSIATPYTSFQPGAALPDETAEGTMIGDAATDVSWNWNIKWHPHDRLPVPSMSFHEPARLARPLFGGGQMERPILFDRHLNGIANP